MTNDKKVPSNFSNFISINVVIKSAMELNLRKLFLDFTYSIM